MIIKTYKKLPTGLIAARHEKDKLVATHIENITPNLREAYLDRQANTGKDLRVTGDKFEKIATAIPFAVFVEHPEFLKDEKALLKWLQFNEEGQQYKSTNRRIV